MEILKQKTVSFTFLDEELTILKSILEKFFDKTEGVGFNKIIFSENEAIILDAMYNAVTGKEINES